MYKKLAGLFAMLTAGLFWAGSALADIATSAHDLSAEAWTGGEICVVCHAPHNNQNTTGELLWNHDPTATSFTAYDSPTLDGASAGPGAISLVCLSCHDGTIAVDSFGGSTGLEDQYIDGVAGAFGDVVAFDSNLGQDHPVGVTYDPVSDTELNATTTAVDYGNAALADGTIADILEAGAIECSSCHDVHNTTPGTNPTLLHVDNSGSAFCLVCHNK